MPHDMIAAEIAEARAPAPRSPGHQRLALLAEALRQPMPKCFRWDFETVYEVDKCGTVGCAMGLGRVIMPEMQRVCAKGEAEGSHPDKVIAEFFDLPDSDIVYTLFYDDDLYGKDFSQVTPADVAGAIEHYLATGKLPDPVGA